MSVALDPFGGGELPSACPEASALPAVRRLLAEQVDMHFADVRALLRLPRDDIAPHVGCNATAAAMLFSQISGFSMWFFHTPYARRIEGEEARRRRVLSGRRFAGFVRAYYPRAHGEPRVRTIASNLWIARNVLAHNLGVDDRAAQRRVLNLVKPDPPLDPSTIVALEMDTQYPLAGVPVRRHGVTTDIAIPGIYWAVGRMLRAALRDHPARCEARATGLLSALPVPVSGIGP